MNLEIGLEIDCVQHTIELHLEEDPLPANRAQLITQLMHRALPNPRGNVAFGVLDVREGA